jgi:hypothetical protein
VRWSISDYRGKVISWYNGGVKLDPRNVEVLDRVCAEIIRRKSGAERLKIANDMAKFARQLLCGGIRYVHPDWNDAEVNAEAARRITRGSH